MGDRIDLAAIRARVEIAGATELRAMVAALCDEVERLREIVAGRTTAPTDAEIKAHAAILGSWLVQRPTGGLDQVAGVHGPKDWREHGALRWWPLDASGAPCAWPVVTEVSRG